ncbi:Tfp pilus assembly protein tip-associated adhesin PilY1-like protein [Thermocrinis albus DSM 14484]|uniref:Tfp pilus assembly protein tip-associated adhesin PilY1-like protein n=1 Tax=Thermocrinis albus (strain DSM 14484 / JCM 11386 / HI 11/12) TaxID=638303 RepID=D3SND7_THEAH|nr:hypothetical protein [Thermocrinis albus]ADC88674.1 Tfp pilus assembly protein tip-associated adhesin PilY1-like protein [Thermocrinis albus DSM 14484]
MNSRSSLLLFVTLMLFLFFPSSQRIKAASINNYCYVPPFVGTAAAPNVMLLIDVSGSMSWCAYNPQSNKSFCCTNSSGCGWTYKGNEEGYFDPNKVYRYNSSQGYWEETTGTPAPCPKSAYTCSVLGCVETIDKTKIYSGSCLNFLYMTRIDLVRWALTGGTPDSCPTDVNESPQNNIRRCDPETYGQPGSQVSCDSYGCVLKSYLGARVKVPWSRINSALLFQFKNLSLKPRIGAMFFSDAGIRDKASVYIGDFTGSNNFDSLNPYKNTITAVNTEDPYGATPTAPALWDTYNYFAQQNPQYGGLKPQSGQGDQWKNPMYQCFDSNNDGQCQGSELKLVPCAKNFVILMTDGQWNVGGPPDNVDVACSIDYGFEQYSADPVVPAYWLHKKGFTNQKTGIYSYVEAVYGIGLFLGGTGERALKNVAMYGSFDRSKSWPDNLSGYPQNTCVMDDCGYGKGSGCTPLPPSSPDWDKNGDNVPDTFYSASNAIEIKQAIYNAFLDILRRSSSGATVAVLTSRYQTTATVLQPLMLPSYTTPTGDTIKWLGFFRGYWVDPSQQFREDTVMDKILVLLGTYRDKIFQYFFTSSGETKAAIVTDQCSKEAEKTPLGPTNQGLHPTLMFDCKLAITDKNSRRIYYHDGTGNLKEYKGNLSDVRSIWSLVDNQTPQDISSIVDYHRGAYFNPPPNNFVKRNRYFDVSNFCPSYQPGSNTTWKLGMVNASTPSVISNLPLNLKWIFVYNDDTYRQFVTSDDYKNRTGIAVIGSYDGMLHFFRVGYMKLTNDTQAPTKAVNAPNNDAQDLLEREEFAFIPYNALPYMLWYGTNDYNNCPVPIVDYRSYAFDASINGDPNAQKTKDSWRTLLLGVMGLGGKRLGNFSSSVFLLDVTDFMKNPSQNMPKLMWEVKLSNGTLTTSFPAVLRLGERDKNGEFWVVLGDGPKDPYADSYDKFVQNPKLYFINARTGQVREVNIPIPPNTYAAVGDIYTADLDFDGADDVIYFGMYGYDKNNKVWGGFYRVALKQGQGYRSITSISSSDIKEAVSLSTFKTNNNTPPVFGRPAATLDDNGNLWVYLATGLYTSSQHRILTYSNYIIGFKDPCWDSNNRTFLQNCGTSVKQSDLLDRTNFQLTFSQVLEQENVCYCDSNGCGSQTVPVRVVPDNWNDAMNLQGKNGWYITLNGMMSYSSVSIYGGIVYVSAYQPNEDVCSAGGNTYAYGLYYLSGTPYFDIPFVAVGNVSGNKVNPSILLGLGASPYGQVFQVSQTSSKGAVLVFQTSTGSLGTKQIQTAEEQATRFILWINK